MSVAALKRWHWLLISIVVGIALAYANHITSADFPAYGDSLRRQSSFEASLGQMIGSDPRFKDLVVQRCRVPKLGDVDFVYGRYCTGQVEKDGAYHYRPKYFVAPVPYRPTGEIPTTPTHDFRSIREFLTSINVPYTHAWWRSYPTATWLTASVALIGLIWPTLINLIVWGRWTRPDEARGISLWRSPSRAAKPARGISAPSFAAPRAAEGDAASASAPVPAASTAAPVRTLSAAPLALAPTATASHKEFGANPDDFYPTEQKARHH
jgi:hypothetical protein